MEPIADSDFRIGPFLVRSGPRLIESPESTQTIEQDTMNLLVYLARNAGQVLPKTQIIDAVWPESRVGEAALTESISRLGEILGEGPPVYVEEVKDWGYILIGEVLWADNPSSVRYKNLKRVAEGGMGEIFLAEDSQLQRQVILKFPRKSDAGSQALLLKEARSAAALDHPFICKIYDTGSLDGRQFIAMEYIRGETLRELLHRRSRLPPDEALGIASDILQALQLAHESGVIHRDLKPSNIMLTGQGHVKITDFGLAQRVAIPQASGSLESTLAETRTAEGSWVGTPAYMSPEQVRGERLDERSDLFSFGILVFEMLTAVHPFHSTERVADGDRVIQVLSAILLNQPASLSDRLPNIPEGLQRLVDKLLAKDRNKRYESAKQVRMDLSALRRRPPVAVPTGSSEPAPQPERPDHPSLAVLPLLDLSQNRDQDYFCDGLTEELINTLARCSGLAVAARTSVFRMRNSKLPVRDIGARLNVGHILEGSVRRAGERVRIALQLVDVENGYELWSDLFSDTLDDVFRVQEDVSKAVAGALQVTLSRGSQTGSSAGPSPEAFESFLKGRFYWNKRTESALNKSLEYFRQAIESDAGYARARAALADSLIALAIYGARPPREVLPLAQAEAEHALSIDPELPSANASLAFVDALYYWKWSEAEQRIRRVLESDSGDANAHHWLAINCLAPQGRFTEAREALQSARRLDPMALPIILSSAVLDYFEGSPAKARETLREVLELDKDFPPARHFLGLVLLQENRWSDSIAELESAVRLSGESSETIASLGLAQAKAGEDGYARKLMERLAERATRRYVSPVLLAQLQIALGQTEEAFELLLKGVDERSTELIWLKVRPTYAELRPDVRFEQLCQKVGLR